MVMTRNRRSLGRALPEPSGPAADLARPGHHCRGGGTPHAITKQDVDECKSQALLATGWSQKISQTTRDLGLGTGSGDVDVARQEVFAAVTAFQDSIRKNGASSLGNDFCLVPWGAFLGALQTARDQLSQPLTKDQFVVAWRAVDEAVKQFSDAVDRMASP